MEKNRLFFLRKDGIPRLPLLLPFLLLLATFNLPAFAAPTADGATEALELRLHAEQAIAEERRAGRVEFAEAMHGALPDLLLEYVATRDGSIALDTVDAAFVQEKFKEAKAMEGPGVALALDVFSGPGTGYEHGLRTAIANLADFNERKAGQVSDAALEAHERVMEAHQERINRHLAQAEVVQNRLEAKLNRLEPQRTEKAERALQKAETRIQAVVNKVETRLDSIVEKVQEKIAENPSNAEKTLVKAELQIKTVVAQVEQRINAIVENTANTPQEASAGAANPVTDDEKDGKKEEKASTERIISVARSPQK